MKAAIYRAFGEPLSIEALPDPEPSAGGVVIAVKATGLCRSDWHGWMGHDPTIRLPHVPGHELAGVVEAVGSDIANWKPGDRVTLPFVCGCGACPQCASGNHQVCDHQFQPGFTHWGSFAEYVAIDYADINLVRLPEELDFVTAASLGCRFVTSFRAVVDQGQVSAGQWVAVHGCGGVGLSAIMISRALNARVVAIDYADINLVRLPEELDFVTAASLGCRFVTSFRAVVDQGQVSAGQWVAVHGCGGVGLSAIMISRALNARVVAIDIDDRKLDFAKGIGAEALINASQVDSVAESIRDVTGGGAHVSIDALGSIETCSNSIAGLRKRGKHIQVGLMVGDARSPALPMDRVLADELEILGSHGMQAHRYPELLGMIQTGKLRPDLLIGNTICLEDALVELPEMNRFTSTGVTVIDRF